MLKGGLDEMRTSFLYHLLVRPQEFRISFPIFLSSRWRWMFPIYLPGLHLAFFLGVPFVFPPDLTLWSPQSDGKDRIPCINSRAFSGRPCFFSCNFISVSGFGSIFEDYGDFFKLFFRRNCVLLILEVESYFFSSVSSIFWTDTGCLFWISQKNKLK